jgi:hypothetical protein
LEVFWYPVRWGSSVSGSGPPLDWINTPPETGSGVACSQPGRARTTRPVGPSWRVLARPTAAAERARPDAIDRRLMERWGNRLIRVMALPSFSWLLGLSSVVNRPA